jgi:propionate CoA-transferase
VQQITFSGAYASQTKQRVLYVTERCVFVLREGRLVLTEIAPGVDLEKDILGRMQFRPEIDQPLKLMDAAFFHAPPTGMLRSWLEK